jgi:hypothetical protein
MNLPKRLRNIAQSQINSIKERLDRIDFEAEEEAERRRYERDARRELDDVTDIRQPMRTPEEIASGKPKKAAPRPSAPAETPAAPVSSVSSSRKETNLLAHHYRVLGVEEDADYSTVQAAYSKLAARCNPDRFPEGSDERRTAEEIKKRVDMAYDALRDALDATAGRFDKLEF